MLTNVKNIKAKGKFLMEFEPEDRPEEAVPPAPLPDVLQPQPEPFHPDPPLPPVLQPVEAAEMLEAMERFLRAHREDTREIVEDSIGLFGRRIEGELRGMGKHLTRTEGQGPSGAKRDYSLSN